MILRTEVEYCIIGSFSDFLDKKDIVILMD